MGAWGLLVNRFNVLAGARGYCANRPIFCEGWWGRKTVLAQFRQNKGIVADEQIERVNDTDLRTLVDLLHERKVEVARSLFRVRDDRE